MAHNLSQTALWLTAIAFWLYFLFWLTGALFALYTVGKTASALGQDRMFTRAAGNFKRAFFGLIAALLFTAAALH